VVRTGRTVDLARRALEHLRDPATAAYDFLVVHRTDDYAIRRGLEQMLYDQYQGAALNTIRPIWPRNPNLGRYMDAARQFLGGL
jgi:hypothetical protein